MLFLSEFSSMTMALQVIGEIIYVIGWLWLVINGLGKSIPFGIVAFCFSPVALIHGLMHWANLNVPTLMMVIGVVLYLIASALRQ